MECQSTDKNEQSQFVVLKNVENVKCENVECQVEGRVWTIRVWSIIN